MEQNGGCLIHVFSYRDSPRRLVGSPQGAVALLDRRTCNAEWADGARTTRVGAGGAKVDGERVSWDPVAGVGVVTARHGVS